MKQALHREASCGWRLKHHGPRLALQVGLGEKSEKSLRKVKNEANQHNDIRHHPTYSTYSACIARMFKASCFFSLFPCVAMLRHASGEQNGIPGFKRATAFGAGRLGFLEDFSSPRNAWHGKSKARLLV